MTLGILVRATLLCFLYLSVVNLPALSQVTDWAALPETVIGDDEFEVPKKIVSVTGTITSILGREPVAGASVSIDVYKYFDYSDARGKYILELPAGRYRLMVRHIGMIPQYFNLNVYSTGVLDIKMQEGVVNLDEVIISARPLDANVRETVSGINKLSVQEIKALPTFMGELDIIKSIQTLPGVTSVGEGSSGFNVRGGRTDQNLILLDGAPLFNASHALGFISGFNQDIVNNFTLYKGNVPGNLGGRASSVLEVNSRQGSFDDWKYQGGVGPISSRFAAEGPIIKDKSSVLIAARTSYADWVLGRVRNPDVKNSSLFFYDANLSFVHRFSESKVLKWSSYSSRDHFKFSQQFAFDWENYLSTLELKTRADQKLSPSFSVSHGQYKTTLIDPSGLDASQLRNRMDYFVARGSFNFIPNDDHSIVAGLETTTYLPRPERYGSYGDVPVTPKRVDRNKGVEAAVFVNDEYEITENFSVSAGLRYSMYSQLGDATVYSYDPALPRTAGSITDTTTYNSAKLIKLFGGLEPRLSLRLNVAETQSVKVGYNRMRQYIHQVSNTTAPTPVDLWQVSTSYLPPQVADNISAGYFLNVNDNFWETSVEFFYKHMNNLVEYKDFPSLYLNPHIETELLSGEGRAFGGELYIRKLKGFWKGWLSYTYSQTTLRVLSQFPSESINGGKWYPTNYNKPHTFNLVINRKGAQKNGAISLIVSYNTGRPFTALETNYIVGTTTIPVYSERNKYRIPNYVRVDFSFTLPSILPKIDDSLTFSMYNLFGRENAYSVFYQRPPFVFVPRAYKLSVLGAAMPSVTYNFNF